MNARGKIIFGDGMKLSFRVSAFVVLLSLLIFSLLFFSLRVSAQESGVSVPEISSTIDKVEAFVGDAFSLTISIIADSALRVAPLGVEKKLGDFDIQDVQLSQPEKLEDGRIRYQTIVKLWALEIGDKEIPSVTVYYTGVLSGGVADGSSIVDSLFTSAISVTINSVVGAENDSAAIKPLREPLPDPLGLNKGFVQSKLFGVLVIVAIVIIGGLVWWFVFRKRKEGGQWVDPRAAWEIAFDRLAELRNQPYLTQGLYKEYYSELTEALRDYLGSALETHTQDMTSSELLSSLENDSLTLVYKSQISGVLTQSDKVKFAMAVPHADRPGQDFEIVYSVIQSLRDDLAERRRKEEERELQAQKNISDAQAGAKSVEKSPANSESDLLTNIDGDSGSARVKEGSDV